MFPKITRFLSPAISCLLFLGVGFCFGVQMPELKFKEVVLPDGSLLPFAESIYQDRKGLMWFGTYGGLFMYDGYELEHFSYDPDDSLSIGDNKIRCLLEGTNDNLWIGTQGGLFIFDVRLRVFTQLGLTDGSGLQNSLIDFLERDLEGNIWIGSGRGLFRAKAGDRLLEKISYRPSSDRLRVRAMKVGNNGDFWVTDQLGLYRKERHENQFERISATENMKEGSPFIGLLFDDEDYLWIISAMGVYKYHPEEERILLYQELGQIYGPRAIIVKDELMILAQGGLLRMNLASLKYRIQAVDERDPLNISKNISISIYHDRQQDQIWIGNRESRFFRHDFRRASFQHTNMEYLGSAVAPEIYEYEPGVFLVPRPEGLFLLNRNSGVLTKFPFQPSKNLDGWKTGVTTFYEDGELLWLGTIHGLFAFNRRTQTFLDFESKLAVDKRMPQLPIRDILKDRYGNLWVAPWMGGLFSYNVDRSKLTKYKFGHSSIPNEDPSCRYLYEDRKGKIWVGTRSGLIKYLEDQDSFIIYRHDANDPQSMSENTSFCIYEDTLGYIWSGSYGGGLNRLDQHTGKFRHFTTKHGLLGNNIFSLLPDSLGNLWLMSYEGVSRFNPYTFTVDNFTHENGLHSRHFDAFRYGRSVYTDDLFFGGRQSIDIVQPKTFSPSDYCPQITFTDFSIFNETALIGDQGSGFYLKKHISFLDNIVIPYDQKSFTFKYAAIDFSGPGRVEYAYHLDGFDSDWQYVKKKRDATYTNLSPGAYNFQVKSTNSDGIWQNNIREIPLTVTPPWWATWGAYVSYALLLASLLYGIYWYERRRLFLRSALRFQEQEAGRLQELDRFKSNLYSNITHEFRTPLTVISGMNDLVRKQPKSWLQNGTMLIEQHCQKLLYMVNQMLDVQKIEAGKMEVEMIQADIVSFINYLVEPFQFSARAKNLDFFIQHESGSLQMDFDQEKLAQIISNVLSNAIKYTKEGKIELSTKMREHDLFEIKVQDSGIGIKRQDIEHVFDRFYQSENASTRRGEGTGIGLALVKELVRMINGSIHVESEVGTGSAFTIFLPVTRIAALQSAAIGAGLGTRIQIGSPAIQAKSENAKMEARVLVIEDNMDVRTYLRSILMDKFQIEEAENGFDGVNKSREMIPDLIICDVMMPGMDGYSVCDTLHQEELTNHIPIILLTAKADLASRKEGYERGADAYLTKPFHPAELLAQISMLLEQRKRLQETYQQQLRTGLLSKSAANQNAFLSKIQSVVLTNLEEESFDIPWLCRELHVSRSQLHKKIKSLTGYSTSLFIRKIRLSEARRLIEQTDLTMAEIAYKSGFEDPNYFSRVYKKEYGITPSTDRT